MGYRMRIFFTDMQTSEIWDRWQRAAAMSSIGRRFDRVSSSIYPLLERSGLGKFNDAVSIRERPAEAEDRAVPGHHCRQGRQGEEDLIAGSGNSVIQALIKQPASCQRNFTAH